MRKGPIVHSEGLNLDGWNLEDGTIVNQLEAVILLGVRAHRRLLDTSMIDFDLSLKINGKRKIGLQMIRLNRVSSKSLTCCRLTAKCGSSVAWI